MMEQAQKWIGKKLITARSQSDADDKEKWIITKHSY